MHQRVLLTGGSGLLALNWALAIRDRFAVALGLHRRSVALGGVECHPLDLESAESLTRALESIKPDIVIHTAGLTSVERCEAEPALAWHVNSELAGCVAQACARLGLPLAHISTDHLFCGSESLLAEAHSVEPINTYGRTKAAAEKFVLEACPSALVIRTNFFGWGTGYRQSFSDNVISGLRAGRELTLFQDVFYTPILAEAATLAVHELIDQKAGGIFNVVGDERVSKYEFGIRLADQFGLDSRLIKQGLIADRGNLVQRPLDMSLSNIKASGILNRKLGGVVEHIARLHEQEQIGHAQELKSL
jgi:dTDP-4-dehydrorhamnose reductase